MGTIPPDGGSVSLRFSGGTSKDSSIELAHFHPYERDPKMVNCTGLGQGWTQSTNLMSFKDPKKRAGLDKRILKVHKARAKLISDTNQQKKLEQEQLEARRVEWRENSEHHQKLAEQETWASERETKAKERLRQVKTSALGRSEERLIRQLNAARKGPGRGTFEIAESLPAKPLHAVLAPAETSWAEPVPEAMRGSPAAQPADDGEDVSNDLSRKESIELERERELRVLVARILSGPWEGFSRAKDAASSDPVATWSECNLTFCAPTASSTSLGGQPENSAEKEMLGRTFGFSKCDDPVLGRGIAKLGMGSEESYERERRLMVNLDGVLDFGSNRLVLQARQGQNEKYFIGELVWRGSTPEQQGEDEQQGPLALTALAARAVAEASAMAADAKATASLRSSQYTPPGGMSADPFDESTADNGGLFGHFPSGTVQNLLTRMLHNVVMCVEADGIALQLRPANRKIIRAYKSAVPPRKMLDTRSNTGRMVGPSKSLTLKDEPLNLRTGYFTPMHHEWRPVPLPTTRAKKRRSLTGGKNNDEQVSASVPALALASKKSVPLRSYAEILASANLLNLGLKGRQAKESHAKKLVLVKLQKGWLKFVCMAVRWQCVVEPLEGAVLDRQDNAARALQRLAVVGNAKRGHRSLRKGAAVLMMRFLKRFVSLRYDSEETWIQRTRKEEEGGGLLADLLSKGSLGSQLQPTESGGQTYERELKELKQKGGVLEGEQPVVQQKPSGTRHVRLFLRMYKKVFILRSAIAKFFRKMLATKRAQARAMNMLWAKVRKVHLLQLQEHANGVLTEGLAIDKKSQLLCGEGAGSNWLWLEEAKMWVDLPKEQKSAPVVAVVEIQDSDRDSDSDSSEGSGSDLDGSPLKQTPTRARNSIMMRVDTREFSTFAHDQLTTTSIKFENAEENTLWKNMMVCSVTEFCMLKTAFMHWSFDYMVRNYTM
jgi:hypothetical protein